MDDENLNENKPPFGNDENLNGDESFASAEQPTPGHDQAETPDITPPSGTPADNEPDDLPFDRHPTGSPEETGGWYGIDDGPLRRIGLSEETRNPVAGLPGWQPYSTGRPQNVPDEEKPEIIPPLSSAPKGDEPTIPPPPILGQADVLPQSVDEIDRFATRVTPAAYQSASQPGRLPRDPAINSQATPPQGTRVMRTRVTPARPVPQPAPQPVVQRPAPQPTAPRSKKAPVYKPARSGGAKSFFLRSFIGLLFALIFILVVVASFGVYQYFLITSSLPPTDNLAAHASQFETTRIMDRNGDILYEVIDPNAGRRTYVPLNKISPYVIAATIATEDQEYYNHPGYDFFAMARALYQNYTSGEIVSGASTITQQLARGLLFSYDERIDQSIDRKAREIVLAAEITRKYSKEEILELYLNENNYGNTAYGIEAAAQTYFYTSAENLNLAQATFLVGIPQSPAIYDIINNREATLNRHKQVLTLLYQYNEEKGCVYVGKDLELVCVTADDSIAAAREIENHTFSFPENKMRFPHWVNYVRSILEEQFGSQTIYRSGFNVYTTIDPEIQMQAEEMVRSQVNALRDINVQGGAAVVLKNTTGEILAMVGSPDFANEQSSGQINMAVSPRQPGSAIKPLTYAAAFEKGWTPATLIWDVPTDFTPSGLPNDPGPTYSPVNYDGRFHGPATVRSSLANSFNIPAVKTLQFVGLYDDPTTNYPDGFINFAKRMGITTLTREDYGLSLTLGGGDVTLLELTGAFSIFGNYGKRIPPISILKITNFKGEQVFEYQPPTGDQMIRPEHAYLISSILSDNSARTPMFGANSVLNQPFQAAVKTGTTNDFRDNWTVGYTPDVTVGVWIGNPDYTPMIHSTGLTGAAPIWSSLMQYAAYKVSGGNPTPFNPPPGIMTREICEVSGAEPSDKCPSRRQEFFTVDQPPLPKDEDLWKEARIDTWTGLSASGECGDYADEKFALNVKDPSAVKWIRETDDGRNWAKSMGFEDDPIFFVPERACKISDPRPNIFFANLSDNQKITDQTLDIYAVVNATNYFDNFRIDWGRGDDPEDFEMLKEGIRDQYQQPEMIYTWDLKDVPAGKITLRIYITSNVGTYAEKKIRLDIQVPTQTPTVSPTPTQTPQATITPSLTPFVPTDTPPPPTVAPPTIVPPTDTPPAVVPSATP